MIYINEKKLCFTSEIKIEKIKNKKCVRSNKYDDFLCRLYLDSVENVTRLW